MGDEGCKSPILSLKGDCVKEIYIMPIDRQELFSCLEKKEEGVA